MLFDDRARRRRGPWVGLVAVLAVACAQGNDDFVYGDDVFYPTVDRGESDAGAATETDVGVEDVPVDAGGVDAGTVDVTEPDADSVDVETPDVVPPDAGSVDVGGPDAGMVDAGTLDTGVRDTGTPDTGLRDVGTPDTGVRDVGFVDLGGPVECAPGASRFCYTGPTATRMVGACTDGVERCAGGRWSGVCDGQRTPAAEACNGLDDDCDGRADDATTNACYSGPAATRGVGACRAGNRTCSSGAWGACAGEVLPADSETCGNAADDDCNGTADDGCSTPSRFGMGNVHTCWLDDAAHAWCWGGNFSGATTYTTTAGTPTPTRAPSLDGLMLAGGEYFGCVLRADRTVACSGLNDAGQIGNGTTTSAMDTVRVAGLSGVTTVAAGYKHACAAVAGGAVHCWGLNDRRQLGATCSGTLCNGRPLAVAGVTGVTQLALGNQHTCALRTGGTVTCWGDNANGQLGRGSVDMAVGDPAAVPGLSGVVAIEAGFDHTCALLGDGTVRCWGANALGQLGDGSTMDRASPMAVRGLSGASRLVVGMYHGCAIVAGRVSCWGHNTNGQIGDNTTVNRPIPVTTTLSGITDIGAGYWHTCARSTGTTLWCWGWNLTGMLGTGSTSPPDGRVPLRVAL